VHVADATDVLVQHRQHLGPAEQHVTGVEQQAHLRSRDGHQLVDIVRRFDVRTHVVVVGQPHAVAQQVGAEGVELPAVDLPLCLVMKTRAPP
jgi:hypothetical protein